MIAMHYTENIVQYTEHGRKTRKKITESLGYLYVLIMEVLRNLSCSDFDISVFRFVDTSLVLNF